jgi:hypothetical protein
MSDSGGRTAKQGTVLRFCDEGNLAVLAKCDKKAGGKTIEQSIFKVKAIVRQTQ